MTALEYWQDAVGRYIKTKREEASLTQEDVSGTSRSALSELENGRIDFRLSTLLTVLDAIDGDISEAFAGKVPTEFHRHPHRRLFDLLAEILQAGGDPGAEMAEIALQNIHEYFVVRKRQRV